MRRATLFPTLALAAAIAAACSGDGSPLPSESGSSISANRVPMACRPVDDDYMEDHMPRALRPGFTLRVAHIHLLMRQGKTAQAQAEMFQLWDLVLKAYYAGQLPGGMSAATQTAVLQFGQMLYCMVGLDGSGLTLGDPLGTGNITKVVFPSTTDQDVIHGSGNAGVRVFGNTLAQAATITVSTITPPAGQFAGPLDTKLDQYGPFFEFHVVPEQTFSQPVFVEECLVAPVGELPPTVQLAHNLGTGIEILPLETQLFLHCDGIAQVGPSAMRLLASGDLRGTFARLTEEAVRFVSPEVAWAGGTGVGGKPKNFSPFGGVDAAVVIEATSAISQSAPAGGDVGSAPSVLVRTTGAHTPLPLANVVFTVTSGGGTIAAIGDPARVTTFTATTAAAGTAAVASWNIGLGGNSLTAAASFPLPASGSGVVIGGSPITFTATGGDIIPWESGGYRYLAGPADHDAGFEAAAFNDAGWAIGQGGFSDHVAPALPFCPIDTTSRTAWASDPAPTDLLLRHTFNIPAGWTSNLNVSVAIDNDVEVWVNGTNVSGAGFRTHEECATRGSFNFSVPHALLVTGSNVIAVRARDRGTAAFVDIQLSVAVVIP